MEKREEETESEDGLMRLDPEDRKREMEKRQREKSESLQSKPREIIHDSTSQQFEDVESLREEFAEEPEEPISEMFRRFAKDTDLRAVFISVFTHEVSRYGELKLEGKFKGQRILAYRKLDQLKDLGLIKFLSVMEIRDKKLSKEKMTNEEKIVLRKFGEWSKSMTEKQKRMYLSKTNYYATTEKGRDTRFLNFLKNARKTKQDF